MRCQDCPLPAGETCLGTLPGYSWLCALASSEGPFARAHVVARSRLGPTPEVPAQEAENLIYCDHCPLADTGTRCPAAVTGDYTHCTRVNPDHPEFDPRHAESLLAQAAGGTVSEEPVRRVRWSDLTKAERQALRDRTEAVKRQIRERNQGKDCGCGK